MDIAPIGERIFVLIQHVTNAVVDVKAAGMVRGYRSLKLGVRLLGLKLVQQFGEVV
jgi:hypothetical protein